AQDHSDVIRMGGQNLLYDWIKGPARLAGGVEELDHRHRRVFPADNRRVRANELGSSSCRAGLGVAMASVKNGGAGKCGDRQNGGHGYDGSTVHDRWSLRERMRQTAMSANAANERSGRGRPPRMVMSALAQDGP